MLHAFALRAPAVDHYNRLRANPEWEIYSFIASNVPSLLRAISFAFSDFANNEAP